MKYNRFIGLLAITVLIASCSSIRVQSDYESGVDFTKFKTFELLDQKNGFPVGFNPLNKSRIEKAIVAKMNELGYIQSEVPDLQITFFVSKKTLQGNSISDYYEDYEYEQKYQAFDYVEGTLVVDIIDAHKKKILWHGMLRRATDENLKTVDDRITKNIEKMFQLFEEQMLQI